MQPRYAVRSFAFALYLTGRGFTPIGRSVGKNGDVTLLFPPAAERELPEFRARREALDRVVKTGQVLECVVTTEAGK